MYAFTQYEIIYMMVSSARCAHCYFRLMHLANFCFTLFKPFSVNIDLVAKYAVICVSVF